MKTQVLWKAVVLFALPATMFFTACDPAAVVGAGGVITENRNTDNFDALDISVPGEVHVTQGDEFKVVVKAEMTLMPYLQTEVNGTTLHVYFSESVRDVDGLEVEITMPAIRKVQLSGSAHLHSHGAFSGNGLDLNLSGSGQLHFTGIDFQTISAKVSGSGSVELEGIADDLTATVSGSGELNSVQCPVQTAEAHVSGSGSIRLRANQSLKAFVSGSGDIWYEGTPILETHISGSGKVRKL